MTFYTRLRKSNPYRDENGMFSSKDNAETTVDSGAAHLNADEKKEWFDENGNKKLPRSRSDWIASPVPRTTTALFSETSPMRNDLLDKAPVTTMELSKLRTIQGFVDPGKMRAWSDDAPPFSVFKYKGEYVLADGNHRASSAWAAGVKEVKVRVADLDANQKYVKPKFRTK